MCMKNIDSVYSPAWINSYPQIGYKIYNKNDYIKPGKVKSIYRDTYHSLNELITDTAEGRGGNGKYEKGFHIFRRLSDAQDAIRKLDKGYKPAYIYKVSYNCIVARGVDDGRNMFSRADDMDLPFEYYPCDVARQITILEEVIW